MGVKTSPETRGIRIKVKGKPRGKPFPKKHNIGAATRYKPGQSGNPSGKPAHSSISKALRARLAEPALGDKLGRTIATLIADSWIAEAVRGNVPALASLADRTEGRPLISAPPGAPSNFLDYIKTVQLLSMQLGAPEGHPNANKLLPAVTEDEKTEEQNDD